MKNSTQTIHKSIVLIQFIVFLFISLTMAMITLPGTGSALAQEDAIALTAIQQSPARYTNIADVGTYREDVITDALLNSCTLPYADSGKVPYWTGYILENKGNTHDDQGSWTDYTGGRKYFVEKEIARIHDLGFNCARVIYSLSYLSNPQDVNSINLSELEQLDELISWGAKYDVHIMLSILGLPGMAKTSTDEENVGRNNVLFKDPAMQSAYLSYMEMLARRYSAIPASLLSFELLAEPQGDWDAPDPMQAYVDTLTPVAKAMWKYNPERILIANDLGKQLPEGLAAIGCCISLHSHIYYVDAQRLLEETGIDAKVHWPMEFLPNIWQKGGKLTLKSDKGFDPGTLDIYYDYYNRKPAVAADGKTVFKPDSKDGPVYDRGHFTVNVPQGAKKVELRFTAEFSLLALVLKQNSESIALPTHGIYDSLPSVKKVTIQVNPDGTTANIDKPVQVLDSTYFYKAFMKPFEDCAKKYGVSFLMTEVGTDMVNPIPAEYVAYHETWLGALKQQQIPWMYNCIHNILAPIDLMWFNQSHGFTDFSQVPGMPYQENVLITEMLQRFE